MQVLTNLPSVTARETKLNRHLSDPTPAGGVIRFPNQRVTKWKIHWEQSFPQISRWDGFSGEMMEHQSVCPFVSSRRETLQVYLGRLHLEIRSFGWTDEALPQTHGSEAIQVRRLWSQLFPVRSLGTAPPEAYAGVRKATCPAECKSWIS